MNISQHAFVPYTGFFIGRYNSSMEIQQAEQQTGYVSLIPTGVKTFQLLNLPFTGAAVKFFEPYGGYTQTSGYIVRPANSNSKYFSVSYSLGASPDVRVIGWLSTQNPTVQLQGFSLGDGLTVQDDEMI